MAVDRQTTDGGTELYRAEEKAVSGRLGEFVPTFHDEAATRPHGWICQNCGGDDVAADTLGRLVCDDCHNTSSPTTWDSGYL